ncbi:MAG: TAXI family TRAP transporter solute-binding subunit [Chloroflexota bacterium]
MVKRALLVLAGVISVLAVISGCMLPTPPAAPKLPSEINIAMANPKPTAMATALADIVSKYTPMKASTVKVSSNAEALNKIQQAASEKVNLSGCMPCHRVGTWLVAQGAYQAAVFPTTAVVGIVDGDKALLRPMFCGAGPETTNAFGIQTTPKSGIKTVADLKGKRIYAEYSNLLFLAPTVDAILKANGMTRNDVQWLKFTTVAAAFKDVTEGKADAVFYQSSTNSSDLAKAAGLYVVPLSADTQKAVAAAGLGIIGTNWPAGQDGNTVDTPTIGMPYIAFGAVHLPEEAGYLITKAVFEHLAEFQAADKVNTGFTKESALLQWDLPYHSGAIKYFKEIGLWKPEMDSAQTHLTAKWAAVRTGDKASGATTGGTSGGASGGPDVPCNTCKTPPK